MPITIKGISRKELIIVEELSNKYRIEQQKTFEDCTFRDKLKFDLFRPAQEVMLTEDTKISVNDMLIEYDGEQHQKPVRFNKITDSQMYKNFISTQIKDWCKDLYCITKNIPLVRINPTRKNNFDAIMQNSYLVGTAQASNDLITVFDINETDFVNFKEATFMIYSGVTCTFKCDKENNCQVCQNWGLTKEKTITTSIASIIERFDKQSISKAIAFQGLEPLDNLKQLLWFIYNFRQTHDNIVIIWTGYTEEECSDLIYLIKEKMNWKNIIVKFGRFRYGEDAHYDPILGVKLASSNQYAKVIS